MDIEKSEFNVAFSYLNTINVLQTMAAEAALQMEVSTWRNLLGTIFRRIAPYMGEKEFPEFDKAFMELSNKINDYLGKQGKGQFKTGIPSELYNELHTYEIKLLRFAKKAELISKMQEDAGAALR